MGNITVSDNVIAEIAYRSICSVYGVEPDNKEFKKFRKNIDVERTPEDNVIVNIKLEVPYGENILSFSENIMKSVTENVSQMTDKTVEAVNVVVTGVSDKEFSKA
ncbi:MAG: Asp23/Gls24 family envelope stress response protein [Fervidobacterium sp.]|uniref:Asp23/Gls24 family envelope stress response protein n=1 Tax=Fervidobacterium sp. TaxID=1871331 RepID=UPI00404A074F